MCRTDNSISIQKDVSILLLHVKHKQIWLIRIALIGKM